ncbi:CPBP family intramembrane glutamic endopeptidase [Robertkochia solimangrovi]|uniref:CPBP family intramembrane glutamic endopeptidase n=1 Tax=Robertkochia solimangrovi TaxID=2213046 RepID=UPI003BB126EE
MEVCKTLLYLLIFILVQFTIHFLISKLFFGQFKIQLVHLYFDFKIYPYLISSILIAPVIEELFFRKFIINLLQLKNSDRFSILFSALLFSLIHFPILQSIISSLLAGLFLGFIYIRFKKIIYCIFFHFIWNAVLISFQFT